jgi:hypothetical protein
LNAIPHSGVADCELIRTDESRREMAQKVQVVLIDDIDGGPADETLRFALDGTTYDIDLSSANAARLRAALAEFVGHARKVSARPTARRSRGRASGRSAEIRAWAKEQGLAVNERGRIPAELAATFDAAHQGPAQ